MNKFRKKQNTKIKGSLTVETAIVLPIVIVTLLFVVNIMNIYMVHTCMQQALNNTAKIISNHAYFIYRLNDSLHDPYEKFLDSLSKENKVAGTVLKTVDESLVQNLETSSEAWEKMNKEIKDVETAINVASKSTADFSNDFKEIWNAFQDYQFPEESPGLVKRLDNFKNSVYKTASSSVTTLNSYTDVAIQLLKFPSKEGDDIKSLFFGLVRGGLVSGATQICISSTFNDYVNKLNVPASRIKDLNASQTQINSDGSITMAVSYIYVNPFSFVNSKNLGFSPLNKEIRMFQSITVKPFVGKNGTSLPKAKTSGTSVWVSKTGSCYHSKKDCGNMNADTAIEMSIFDAKYKYSSCRKCCYPNGDPKKEEKKDDENKDDDSKNKK